METEHLKEWLPRKDVTRSDRLLLVLASEEGRAKPVKEVRRLAVGAGARDARKWNISGVLARTSGAVNTGAGWELNNEGKGRVAKLLGSGQPAPPPVATSLRRVLAKVSDENTLAFLDEAVKCYEARLYRAAAVLSWVGAVSLLYTEVLANHLPAFNTEAARRDPKWRPAKNGDGLARMKEADFLEMIEYLGVIGKNVKEELQICLKLRNGSGHPSSLRVAENRVAAHIETLILHVFGPFTKNS